MSADLKLFCLHTQMQLAQRVAKGNMWESQCCGWPLPIAGGEGIHRRKCGLGQSYTSTLGQAWVVASKHAQFRALGCQAAQRVVASKWCFRLQGPISTQEESLHAWIGHKIVPSLREWFIKMTNDHFHCWSKFFLFSLSLSLLSYSYLNGSIYHWIDIFLPF